MRPDNFNVQELIDALQGTCTTIQEHLPEGMEEIDLSSEDHDAIDSQIFLCSECEWWCEICEATEDDDGRCEDCSY